MWEDGGAAGGPVLLLLLHATSAVPLSGIEWGGAGRARARVPVVVGSERRQAPFSARMQRELWLAPLLIPPAAAVRSVDSH